MILVHLLSKENHRNCFTEEERPNIHTQESHSKPNQNQNKQKKPSKPTTQQQKNSKQQQKNPKQPKTPSDFF